ncbi:MAG: four helix bundle protein [Bacteroidaceae bacterium]|nr:four helix bundle protein [Bacteroidaceae bacterium]
MGHIAKQGRSSILNERSKSFSVDIVNMVKQNNDWRLNSLFQQVLRSATSIHANIRESEFAQSPADFISKLSIARKEANETMGWLEVLFESQSMSEAWFITLHQQCDELLSILTASIKTTKQNYNL